MFKVLSTLVICSGLISACGGGGAASNTESSVTPKSTGTLGGISAVGAPLANATVTLKCASQTAITTLKSNENGEWSASIPANAFPCAAQVSGGTIRGVANAKSFHAIAVASGILNITPFTDILVSNIVSESDLQSWFSALSTSNAQIIEKTKSPYKTAITQAQIDIALTKMRLVYSSIDALKNANPLTTKFSPVKGDPLDDALETYQSAITNTNITHSELLEKASYGYFGNLDPLFNYALKGVTVIDNAPTGTVVATYSGTALAGNLSGATVDIFTFNNDATIGALIGRGITASNGTFSVETVANSPQVLIRVKGGTYISPSDTTKTQKGGELFSVSFSSSGDTGIMVNPITSIVTAYTISNPNKKSVTDAFVDGQNSLMPHFAIWDSRLIHKIVPSVKTYTENTEGALGLAMGFLDQLAANITIAPADMQNTLYLDASDGRFDSLMIGGGKAKLGAIDEPLTLFLSDYMGAINAYATNTNTIHAKNGIDLTKYSMVPYRVGALSY